MPSDVLQAGKSASKHPAGRLRELLGRPEQITVCPGVYDGLTARIALNSKFECLYMVRWHITPSNPVADFLSSLYTIL